MMGQWWFLWGLGSALGLATSDALMKRFFTDLSPYGMALLRLCYTVPILTLGWLWTPIPALGPDFFLVVAVALPLEAAAGLLYMLALKTAPLSVCAPMMAFTPLLLILTGWLLLQETLNIWGILGIGGIAWGSYLLNVQELRRGWLAPWSALWRLPGPRWMLLAAALYAITSALGKLAVLQSAPTFFGLFYPTVFSGLLLVGYPWSSRPGLQITQKPVWGLMVGFCMAVSILCHFQGISQAPAAYLIAIKRTSLLFSVLYGGLWLGEGHFLARVTGALCMAAGVGFITILGS
ncbi:MAG: DMT family transporter [Deltaproteobacteria bacterium]|nr:DMT family transporter [Deltaproteobacteria bacterium]